MLVKFVYRIIDNRGSQLILSGFLKIFELFSLWSSNLYYYYYSVFLTYDVFSDAGIIATHLIFLPVARCRHTGYSEKSAAYRTTECLVKLVATKCVVYVTSVARSR